jgi:hypothetical protein
LLTIVDEEYRSEEESLEIMKFLSVPPLVVLLLRLEHTIATSFSYNDDLTCDDPPVGSITIDSALCGGDSVCAPGENLEVSGELTLSSDMSSSELCATVKACFMGVNFMCMTFVDTFNPCQEMNLQSEDGAVCPAAGTYSFSASVKLPGESHSLGTGKFAKRVLAWRHTKTRVLHFVLSSMMMQAGG